jgi:hypothetical protein
MIWKYTDSTNQVVYRINDDGSCESHLVEVIADWLAEGNTPEPADIPPVIIPTLTMRQARLALLGAGLLDEVEAVITTPSDRIWWDYSTIVERNHPLVNAVLTALGKTESEIDEMFIGAATL